MEQGVYEIVALGARYLFTALMALIVARAWRNTVIDSRRAQTLRKLSPETGISGELLVMEGGEQARRGMRYPLIREGMVGSAGRADVRIRHSSVRRRHALFQLTPEGLALRAHAGAPMRDRRGRPARSLLLKDGDKFSVGGVRLMLVLTDAPQSAARRPNEQLDDLFDTDPDRLFNENPILNRGGDALYQGENPSHKESR